jgi:hypothetical protein
MAAALLIAPSASAQGRSHPREIKQWFVRKPPVFQEQSWTVQGEMRVTQEDALADALEKAQAKVRGFLLEQDPPIRWVPLISFIRRELVKDREIPEEGEAFKGEEPKIREISVNGHRAFEEKWKVKDDLVKELHRVSLNVRITPEAWGKILEEQRNDLVRQRHSVMKERMLFLLKIMGGLVVLLATVAGYIRMDEWSKGYYTNWLRLAVLSCAGVVAAGWWLFLAN